MGSGGFNPDATRARAAQRQATGQSAFTHQAAVSAGKAQPLHDSQSIVLKDIRESRDFDGKGSSLPILTFCDTTGSMRTVPEFLVKELAGLGKAVQQIRAIPDPQYAFGVIGDGPLGDAVAISIGEFEADDKLVEQTLANLYLGNGGGGNGMESYELALYVAGYKVQTDAWEKRGQKGVLILIGDEAPYPMLETVYAKQFLGERLEKSLSTKEIVERAMERWEVYLLRPSGTMHEHDSRVIETWVNLLGDERVIKIEDWNTIVPTMAALICGVAGVQGQAQTDALLAAGFDPTRVSQATALVPQTVNAANAVQAVDLPTTGKPQVTALEL